MNPYQQNIDIIKAFFRRKLILAFAVFTILPVFPIVFLNVNELVLKFDKYIGMSKLTELGNNTTIAGTFSSLYILFIFEILLAIVFLLFYVKSASEESSLKAPIGIFRVVSVIELIITALILLGMVFVVLFTSLYLLANHTLFAIFVVPCMFLAIPLIIFQIFTQNLFAGNIKESVNSIYLKKNGAKLYGIASVITAFLCLYTVVMIMVFGINDLLLLMPLAAFFGLNTVKNIFGALVGFKYAKYIEGYSDSSTAREIKEQPEENDEEKSDIIICKKCGKTLTPDDYFCNHCGTPVEK